ncbi:MAG TPA: hypothetical protein VHL58_00340 [Thermoanaerobaculia bacterium]|nr:hypothetical protein [Thermoanaerobaculia bacterium]
MKRLLVLAGLALLSVSSVFAQSPPSLCDITSAPAATLLLPYFSVDFANADRTTAVDTLFTITNVSDIPAIAHVTVWSDWSFPVLDFNIFLTGYDVQGVSMYDIINRGVIPITSSATIRGARSASIGSRIVPLDVTACVGIGTGGIPLSLLAQIRSGLTGGAYFNCAQVGDAHTNAVGYVTVDVANKCSQSLPTEQNYFASEILYDNQLIGDFQRVAPSTATGNFAGGNPMVAIKAVPSGGTAAAGALLPTPLPYTFYDRYTPDANRKEDRRQPLPALFAARYIGAGSGFTTSFLIWREGVTGSSVPSRANGGDLTCASYSANGALTFSEMVRFDERENPTGSQPCNFSPCAGPTVGSLPETSARAITGPNADPVFPGAFPGTTDGGGWLYLNLNNSGTARPAGLYSLNNVATNTRASQNWVVIEMTAEGRYGVDFDAAYLGNGCTAPFGITAATNASVPNTPQIGPQ